MQLNRWGCKGLVGCVAEECQVRELGFYPRKERVSLRMKYNASEKEALAELL